MQVDFYHLVAAPVERVLPRIAERIVADGGRLLIVADEALLARLDTQLWTYSAESFLAHAIAGGEDDASQPILLAATIEAGNGARNIALADGVWRDEALGFDRAFYLFDDTNLAPARAAWKALAGRVDIERRFWKQDEAGRWTQAA